MPRRALTDGSGKWFETETAICWAEAQFFDGRNHVSMATNDQWVHEYLYLTKKNMWILNRWSQWQGSVESYEAIKFDDAVKWLTLNGHNEPEDFDQDELKPSMRIDIMESIKSLET